MNKNQLRDSYVAQGWEVDVLPNWTLVGQVEGKVKYDVNVVSPNGDFFTAQVVVTDDGGAGETAVALGKINAAEPTDFDQAAYTYAQGMEGGQVWSVVLTEVNIPFETAKAEVVWSDGSIKNFAIKRRNDAFTQLELI